MPDRVSVPDPVLTMLVVLAPSWIMPLKLELVLSFPIVRLALLAPEFVTAPWPARDPIL